MYSVTRAKTDIFKLRYQAWSQAETLMKYIPISRFTCQTDTHNFQNIAHFQKKVKCKMFPGIITRSAREQPIMSRILICAKNDFSGTHWGRRKTYDVFNDTFWCKDVLLGVSTRTYDEDKFYLGSKTPLKPQNVSQWEIPAKWKSWINLE